MSDYRELLAKQIREALGDFNDPNKPVIILVEEMRIQLRHLKELVGALKCSTGPFDDEARRQELFAAVEDDDG